MFPRIPIFEIVLLSAAMEPTFTAAGTHNITTCEEFERDAFFNPYEVLDSMWKIFYFWAETTEINPIVFSLPAKKRMEMFRAVVEAVDSSLDIEWNRAALLMEPRPDVQVLLLSASTNGAFRALVKKEQRTKVRPHSLPLIKFADIRMKLVNRYIAMMCCEELTAYVMARVDEMPKTEEECKIAAATTGYRGTGGRSYLNLEKVSDEL